MDVDTVIEIYSPEVQQGLANAKLIVQTLIPEVYRIYEANKEGVLRSPVSVMYKANKGVVVQYAQHFGKQFLSQTRTRERSSRHACITK